jgi:hypothetical protein
MSILIECPTCQRRISVPAHAAGQRVECPGCEGLMTVPEMEGHGGSDVKRRLTLRRDDNDDDRPRRRPRDDDSDDDYPRRPRRKPAGLSSEQKLYIGIGGGVAALLILGLALWGFGAFKKSALGGATTASGRTAPAGWTAVNDKDFSAFMPGTPRQTGGAMTNATVNGVPVQTAGSNPEGVDRQSNYHCTLSGNDAEYRIICRVYDSHTVGTTEDFLAEELRKIDPSAGHYFHRSRRGNDGISVSAITTAGKNGYEFRYDEIDHTALKPGEKDPFDTPFFNGDDPDRAKKKRAQQAADFKTRQKHAVYRVFADGKRVFIFSMSIRGKEIDAEIAKTFFESFEPK